MSDSVSAHICFGIALEEGDELPWEKEGFSDANDWWRHINGYKASFEIFENGNYIGGVKPAEDVIDRYYKERREWEKAHPLPVEYWNAGSHSIPSYVLVVPQPQMICGRWEPSAFDPADLVVPAQALAAFEQFCQRFSVPGKASWQLCCFAP